jgi:hypothetical protein
MKREIELRAGEEINADGRCYFVYYRDVPLVNNGYYKVLRSRGYLAFEAGEEDGDGYYYISLETPNCNDSVDYHTYGEWKTIEEAEAWLAHPVSLY